MPPMIVSNAQTQNKHPAYGRRTICCAVGVSTRAVGAGAVARPTVLLSTFDRRIPDGEEEAVATHGARLMRSTSGRKHLAHSVAEAASWARQNGQVFTGERGDSHT